MIQKKKLSLDDKLDRIMEAMLQNQQLLVSTLKAIDKVLESQQSKIIKQR